MNLNKAMIIGNLTKDPEVRSTTTGINVASFSVATNIIWTDQSGQRQEKAEYHNVVAWKKLADICAQYLKRGSKVYIEGRLQTREWVGQDGVKRYRTEIITENMIMLDRPSAGFSPGQAQASAPQKPEPYSAPQPSQQDNNEEEIKLEDIPF
jgi:single-strand DNA-binding protein